MPDDKNLISKIEIERLGGYDWVRLFYALPPVPGMNEAQLVASFRCFSGRAEAYVKEYFPNIPYTAS